MRFYTKKLKAELLNDFQSYFEFKGKCSGCWCMNHHLPIGLDFEVEAAKLAMKQFVESGRLYGVLAYTEGDSVPVGWASLSRKEVMKNKPFQTWNTFTGFENVFLELGFKEKQEKYDAKEFYKLLELDFEVQ